ncbi:DNA-binding transcriptional LysR family regulator [Streptosporangium becharense]|uniref:DNA-binding transcriptional LysR family regulator n=1 Tax=Streptosporangium becharense TaxID=1816182 RepID=A0A7W9IAT8_9ACTN|nr:LysR family transcriptional regulator [Streptosporangium becharense]MBB2914237.1 DNA-binding transcriptional LysR family regulator [Streptosporangium becharense]MBB5817264.1 DNA-binding transcriptional LysR family regulator [Streptosporangium becharense]
MGLKDLDLNLLVTLHALLEERNVTRAGQRIGLSQPATSAALARLRRHFDDELLLRVGNGFELTPLAASLVDATALAVNVVDRVFSAKPDFDPATSDREFVLVSSDYALALIGGELTRTLEREAPGVRLRFLQINIPRVDDIDTTLRSVDGLLMPHGFISTHPAVDVYTDRWVIIADRDHPELRRGITMDHLRELPWAVTFHSPTGIASAARQLTMLGVEPRVEVVVENFQSLPFLVPGTRRIALIQERLARRLEGLADFQVLPCPYEAVPVIEAFWYHTVNQADAGHRWLREVLVDVGKRVERR